MGSKALGILLIVLAIWGGWVIYEYWIDTKNRDTSVLERPVEIDKPIGIEDLGRFPDRMENDFSEAQRIGAQGLRGFLSKYQNSPFLKDPRKAWIQLDYVIMVSLTDPSEARKVFREVKGRTKSDSLVYPRLKKMESTYQ